MPARIEDNDRNDSKKTIAEGRARVRSDRRRSSCVAQFVVALSWQVYPCFTHHYANWRSAHPARSAAPATSEVAKQGLDGFSRSALGCDNANHSGGYFFWDCPPRSCRQPLVGLGAAIP